MDLVYHISADGLKRISKSNAAPCFLLSTKVQLKEYFDFTR